MQSLTVHERAQHRRSAQSKRERGRLYEFSFIMQRGRQLIELEEGKLAHGPRARSAQSKRERGRCRGRSCQYHEKRRRALRLALAIIMQQQKEGKHELLAPRYSSCHHHAKREARARTSGPSSRGGARAAGPGSAISAVERLFHVGRLPRLSFDSTTATRTQLSSR